VSLSPTIARWPVEIPVRQAHKPLKRELIYDGAHGKNLLFTERVYEVKLNNETKVRPLAATIESVPATITLNGAELRILSFTPQSISYTVERAWE
jgi:hypothetical protein